MPMKPEFPYPLYTRDEICQKINTLAKSRLPFLFIIDYKAESGYVIALEDINQEYIRYCTEQYKTTQQRTQTKLTQWDVKPISIFEYESKFKFVKNQIQQGNSFLTNLTQKSEVLTNLNLLDIYETGCAKYKLWIKDQFTVLSPETFVRIQGNTISSFPMKGTIDASIPNAKNSILANLKEKAEHATIVDLIRNDLSLIASNVTVKRYRYVEKISTNKKDLLQVSSEIVGTLPPRYHEQLGTLLFRLLPAGSISGAPKSKTLEIISQAEGYERGFYSGIWGIYDGENLDSAVMIRFIEQNKLGLIYKSGGGITSKSDLNNEYEELIQKIYVPIS